MINEYFRLKTDELLNELLQIKSFIKKHNPTIGVLTEEILRKFLSTYLPKSISIEQGFVLDEKGNMSKQIDILIYDSSLYSPFYRINDIVVVPNKAVIAMIEVKTTVISKTSFHEIINYFKSTSQILHSKTAKHLFIYNSSSVSKLNEYFHNYKHKGGYDSFDHDTFQDLPDAITGIDSSYHLRKDLVAFNGDSIGYTSYIYEDSTSEEISSLELFYKLIHSTVFNYINSKYNDEFSSNANYNLNEEKKLKGISAIELFSM